jgi:hypothetical protein
VTILGYTFHISFLLIRLLSPTISISLFLYILHLQFKFTHFFILIPQPRFPSLPLPPFTSHQPHTSLPVRHTTFHSSHRYSHTIHVSCARRHLAFHILQCFPLTQVLHQKPHTAVLREREGVDTHILPPLRARSTLTTARNPSAVDGTTINFSPLSWAVRPPGQDARNEARKQRVSLTPEIKMGVLLGRCSAGKQVLFTWAFGVVPTGMPLRGRTCL